MTAPVKYVARKTVTHIQEGSVYKDRFTLPFEPAYGSTARIMFLVSDGSQVGEDLAGELDGKHISFRHPYASVEEVPNGALFYIYLHLAGEDAEDEDMAFYGTVFRRQHVFPDSPAISSSTVVRSFEDTFQRPAGAVGGRWKVLVGRPRIFDNTEWFGLGEDHPNTVGTNWDLFSSFYMYYYQPFNDDSVALSLSATKKGGGKTLITLCGNSSATSYLYVGFDALADTVELGYGTGPNIGPWLAPTGVLEPQITPVALEVPGDDGLGTYKVRYDDVTKTLGIYSADLTTTIAEWTDEADVVPHGKGYRYFGMAGNSGILDSGIQLAYINAHGAV
jgi:hypothetical protein